jgi:predicted DNA-binding transcriptional regulator AlpA
MPAAIVTIEDLEIFKTKLISEIKELLVSVRLPDSASPRDGNVQWLKHKDVCALVGISVSTLQRLRICGKLPSKKLGRQHFYRLTDIEKLMSNETRSGVKHIL